MLFRFLLIVTVLLTSVEGAPINISEFDSRALTPAKHFLFGFMLGVICTIICGHLKKNISGRNVTGQDSMDADIENRANPTGEHEDEIMTVNQDAPHGPMAEERDVLKNTNISRPGPHYGITTIDPYEDMIISSDQDVNDDARHGLMAKNRDVLKNTNISSLSPHGDIITADLHADMIISSDKDVNDDALHGLMAKKRDVLKNSNISTPGPHGDIITNDSSEDMVISSNKEQENEITTVNDGVPYGPMDKNTDVLKHTNISTPGPGYVVINMDPDEDSIISSDRGICDKINAETKHVLENNNISISGSGYVIINVDPDEDVDIFYDCNDGEHVDEINILNHDAPHGPIAENRCDQKQHFCVCTRICIHMPE
ncbi:uncharacterized protein LOC143809831 [Ranitomeya variabilis]|uniref:uncharacterized protein LOC143809831 n=1 Tax=Ranitomeya variabilis TaxID=490064 RepID=UPI00405702B6